MPMDYHIYLQSKQSASVSEKTVPFELRGEEAQSTSDSIAPFISKGLSTAQQVANTGFGTAVNAGVSALAKAVPWVAVAVALVKITDKILTTTFTNIESYTGDYTHSVKYSNLKNGFSIAINPLGLAKRMIERNFEFDANNKKINAERLLVGQATLRNMDRGV